MVENFGDVATAAAMNLLAVKYYSSLTRLCIVRGPTSLQSQVHAALALVKQIKQVACAIRVLHVCGSARTLKPAIEYWHKTLVHAMAASARGDEIDLDEAFLDAIDADLADAVA